MIRISQLKLPCGHSEEDLSDKIRQTLRVKGTRAKGDPQLRYEIRRHSVDARKKPKLFDIYTVDVDTGWGFRAEKKCVAKLRSK